jgi:molybdenum cofactor cytidylyltransferase
MPLTQPKNDLRDDINIAGVILAAGESSRFGRPKQLSSFKEKTFIENVVETALTTGLSPVVVVLGSHLQEIKPVLEKYNGLIAIIENPNWNEGQSSSIRVAIESITNSCRAAIFLLVDQPQIEPELVLALISDYFRKRSNIIAPFIGERRGNPVLFDKVCFDRLTSLTGDRGGRTIFKEFGLTRLNWEDKRILFDVDNPEDYEELKTIYE